MSFRLVRNLSMRMKNTYCTYIMANDRPTLYTGMTNNLLKRVLQHKQELVDGFTKKYHLHKLVYYETFETPLEAIIREKQLKNLGRDEKISLIRTMNPTFRDLLDKIKE